MLGVLVSGTVPASAELLWLRTAFQDTASKVVRHADGTFGGICVDLMNLIEKNSNFRFLRPTQFVSLKRIELGLSSQSVDVYFALLRNPERAQICRYLEPLYSVHYVIVGRADDQVTLRGVDDLKRVAGKGPLLTVFGSQLGTYIQSLGLVADDGAVTVEQNLGKLLSRRGRFFLYQDIAVHQALAQPPFAGKLRVFPLVLRTEELWLVSSFGVGAAVNDGLKAVVHRLKASGEWKSVVDRYVD